MILLGEPGPGIVDDRDLPAFADRLVDARGRPVDDELVAAFIASRPGSEPELRLAHEGARLRVERIDSAEVAERLRFDPHPAGNTVSTGAP